MDANEVKLINEIRDHDLTKRKLERARDRIAELEAEKAKMQEALGNLLAESVGLAKHALEELNKRMAITEQNSKLHKELRKIKKLVSALLDDIYEFGTPPPGRVFDELETMVREPTLTILHPDGTTTDVHPLKAWEPGDFKESE